MEATYADPMARPIELVDVAAQMVVFGDLATLVTVTADARPHVGTVLVSVGSTGLAVRVGGRTRDHIQHHPAVSLVWLRDGIDYQLIVDGVAVVVGDAGGDGLFAVDIDVQHGIMHRVAGRTDGPTCRALRVVVGS